MNVNPRRLSNDKPPSGDYRKLATSLAVLSAESRLNDIVSVRSLSDCVNSRVVR